MMAGPMDFIGGMVPSGMDVAVGITQVMQGIMWIAVIGGIAFILFKFKLLYRFPVDIDILQVRKGVLSLIDKDKARRVRKKDGEEYYDVKKRNFKWYPPTFEGQMDIKGGKKTKLYVEELSHNNWRIIDPASFVKADPKAYKLLERESQVRYWKNLEDMKDELKWKKEDKWKSVRDMAVWIGLGAFMFLFFYGAGTYIITPVLGTINSADDMIINVLEKSNELLERSTQYVELILKQNNVAATLPWLNTTNESVIV